jgi:prophage regulatory protein
MHHQQDRGPLRVIRRAEVQARLGIGRSTLYSYLNERSPNYLPTFPKPIRIGTTVGFIEHELDAFVTSRMKAREAES